MRETRARSISLLPCKPSALFHLVYPPDEKTRPCRTCAKFSSQAGRKSCSSTAATSQRANFQRPRLQEPRYCQSFPFVSSQPLLTMVDYTFSHQYLSCSDVSDDEKLAYCVSALCPSSKASRLNSPPSLLLPSSSLLSPWKRRSSQLSTSLLSFAPSTAHKTPWSRVFTRLSWPASLGSKPQSSFSVVSFACTLGKRCLPTRTTSN